MKFSITIPAYKRTFLYDAVESCLAQTYQDFELVIVDDASPEDLQSVVSQFQDKRIRYYRNAKNCGALNVVDNWNICLSYVTGDYVICMGDDDRLLPDCLATYARLIDNHPGLGVYHGWTEIIDEQDEVVRFQEPRPIREPVSLMMLGRMAHGRLQYIGDWLFDVCLLRANGGFYHLPFAWGSDDLTAYIAARETGTANTQVPVFQYRISSQTISNSGNEKDKISAINGMQPMLYAILDAEHPQTETDLHINKICRNSIAGYLSRRRVGTLQDLFRHSHAALLWWLRHSSEYSITKRQVVKAWIKSFIKK